MRLLLYLAQAILSLMSFGLFTRCQTVYIANDEGHDIRSDSSGIYSENLNFSPERLFPKKSWEGDWIWLNESAFRNNQLTQTSWERNPGYKEQYKALFRKSFGLTKVPEQVFMSITADVFFRVYINGIFVAQGPANTGSDYFDKVPPGHWFFNIHNVKKYLNRGSNTIAVEVFSHAREISETSSGYGMLICDLDEGINDNILASDTSWKCTIDTSFISNGGSFTSFAGFEKDNWQNISFDDSGWEAASVVKFAREGYLVNSEIPVPFRYPIRPERVWLPGRNDAITDIQGAVCNRKIRDTVFTLDYDRNLTAYYGFEVDAHENDTIEIYPYEKKYASLNRPLVFVCKKGENVFYAPYLSVFRYLKVRIKSREGMVVKNIRADFSSYPVSYAGSFSCSDRNLTELWDITRWTTQLCMNDMYYDSPKHQEPIACTGDYLIESLINYYAFGDPWLTRQTLLKTALVLEKNSYDMFHTSYSLLWIQMLHHYYLYTGDIQLVKELLPHVNKLTGLFETYLDGDYLVSNAPDYMFMDWIKIDKFNAHHPPAVIGMGYMTAFYYKSLLDASCLNSLGGNSAESKRDLELAGKIKIAMNTLLWDKSKMLYRDGIPFRNKRPEHSFFPKDTNIVTYSPHVNALAVLYDIAPLEQQPAIMNYVVNQKAIDLQPYFMFYVLSAVDHKGIFSTLGLELLKKWENGINRETHTLKENWQDKTETGYGGDYSHAWGGSPLYFMSAVILGVRPSLPGFREIEISPFISDSISWAKGTVPLSDGTRLEIGWEKESKLKYTYWLDIPDGTECFLVVPKELRGSGIMINGTWHSGDIARIRISSGTHEIEFL